MAREVALDESAIDAIFAEVDRSNGPGAAVGISVGGRPAYRKGFGLANVELPVGLSPSIRMRLISVTKPFTSLAFLLLCDEGLASLDDPVGNVLHELHPASLSATFRQLMAHTSGLRDAHEISWQFSGTRVPVDSGDLLALYRGIDDANALPGSRWIYNNGGYLLLTAAIERLSGWPLERYLAERICAPLGMHDTILRRRDIDLVPNSASAHVAGPGGGYERSTFFWTALAGEGGLVSTVDDMLRWLRAMDAPPVGSPATWAAMKTPQVLSNGTDTGRGLGFFVGSYRGAQTLFHPGAGVGCNAWMVKVPEAALDVIVMSNSDQPSSGVLAHHVLDACLPDLDPIPPSKGKAFGEGVYRSPKTGMVVQLRGEEGIASIEGRDLSFEPDAAGQLWPSGVAGMVARKLAIDVTGAPATIRVVDFGNTDELLLVGPARPSDATRIAGSFESRTTGTRAAIVTAREGLRFNTSGAFGQVSYEMEALADNIWRALPSSSMPWSGGILSFDEAMPGFRFSSLRTRGLRFYRTTSQ